MATDSTISQLFAALLSGATTPDYAVSDVETEQPTQAPGETIHPMDTLHAVLGPLTPDDGRASLETLPSPSPEKLTQAVQIETNRLLEEVLDRVAHTQNTTDHHDILPDHATDASMAFVDAVVSDGGGGGMAIYNAAFLPGWPFQLFDRQSSQKLDELRHVLASQGGRNEAKVVGYLSGLGLNKDLLQKIVKTFKTAAERTNFLVWISACFVIVVRTLRTLRDEIIDPILNADDDLGTGFRQALSVISPKDRRFLKI